MKRVANFEKISYDEFYKSFQGMDPQDVWRMYDNIKLPKRATSGSAGYDFYMPFNKILEFGESVTVPTGIRCRMNDGWVLVLSPRSSLGFKYYVRIANIFPVIDSDYHQADNEGHIFIKIRNEGEDTVTLKEGDAFCQGIFFEYGITDFDDASGERTGGFGSTDKPEEANDNESNNDQTTK